MTAVSASAEEPARKESLCATKEAGQKQQNCSAQQKRAQLKSKKLSPEIRTGKLDRDQEFDLNKLYPFIAGSGLVQ